MPYALCAFICFGDTVSNIRFYRFAVVLSIFLFFPSTSVHAQSGKEDIAKKQAQAEIAADSNQYVIGAEDVLYIHTWKEESLFRTVPVRMDGKMLRVVSFRLTG